MRMNDLIKQKKEENDAQIAFLEGHFSLFDNILEDFDRMFGERYTVDMSSGTLDLMASGKKEVLNTMFHILRKHGLKPSDRPQELVASFSTFWSKEDELGIIVFMSYSSTECVLKKVGTKMEERPIYEVVCNENSAGATEITL